MLQQLIYTRCKPRRELLDNGKIIDEEGIAIHNFSEECINTSTIYDPLLLEMVLKKSNASKELGRNAPGRFTSYEYFSLPDGSGWMGEENSWQYYEKPFSEYQKEDKRKLHPLIKKRDNGQEHRPEQHIKQYLIGDFINYPCLFFGAKQWDAFPKEENYYYHDNYEPMEYLTSVDDNNLNPLTTLRKVKEFLEDGREECIKYLVAMILEQMSKKIEEQMFIVIKDIPKNVELWVTAVEFSFPIYLAKQISFNTNVVATKDLSVDNVYYVDDRGKYIKEIPKDAREGGGRKKYFSMIVGIHPAAQDSTNIIMGMNNVSFILLDGERKEIEKKMNVDISRSYYLAVSKMNEDIIGFDKLLGELSELQFGSNYTDIYDLFDAYKYMLGNESITTEWDYKLVKKYLSIFRKYEKTPYKWSQCLAEKTYGVYKMFLDVDIKEGLTLLKQIISMDYATILKKDIEALLLDEYLHNMKTRTINLVAVTDLGKLLNTVYTNMYHIVAQGIKESVTSFIDLAEYWNAEQSLYIFTKLYESNSDVNVSNQEWYHEELNEKLISLLLNNIYQDNSSIIELMKYVKNSSLYLEFAIKGIERDYCKWSDIISTTIVDSKLELICGAVLEVTSMDMVRYEEFMIYLLNASKSVSVVLKYLVKAMEKFGVVDSSTEKFVNSYIEMYGKRPSELKMLVESMIENNYGQVGEELAYQKVMEYIDSIVTVDNLSKVLIKEFEIWRTGLKKPRGRAYTIILVEDIGCANIENIYDVLDRYLSRECIIVNELEMQWILVALGNKKKDSKVLVRIYHLIKESGFNIRKGLFDINLDNPTMLLECMRLYLSKPYIDWRLDYQEDIQQIEEDIYSLIKNENLDKIEKMLVKVLDKKSSEAELLKHYFSELKRRVKEEKETEKQKEKELKKEEKKLEDSKGSINEKKKLFLKLFSKK